MSEVHVFINDNSKHIFTPPNPLIVHGTLRWDHRKAKRKEGKRKKIIYLNKF